MKGRILAWSLLFVVVFCCCSFAEEPQLSGKICEVTVYRGQALVKRIIDVDLPDGSSQVLVTDLPDRIVSDSLYAEGSDRVRI